MKNIEQWSKEVAKICLLYSEQFLTHSKMISVCDELLTMGICPLSGFTISISHKSFQNLIIGTCGEDSPNNSTKFPIGRDTQLEFTISIWISSETNRLLHDNVISTCNASLKKLAETFWKSELRDDRSKLHATAVTSTNVCLNNTIVSFLNENIPVAIYYIDLDKFKEINDRYGQVTGDRVIAHFAKIIAQSVGESGVPIHAGGDEFSLLLPINHPGDALSIAREIAVSSQRNPYVKEETSEKISLSVSIGISIADPLDSTQDTSDIYDRHFSLGEEAIKPGGNKTRGTARLFIQDGSCNTVINTIQARNCALAITKARIFCEHPYASPWLNLISKSIFEVALENDFNVDEVTRTAFDLSSWINPNFNVNALCSVFAVEDNACMQPEINPFDFSIAVAHGLLRAYAVLKKNNDESSLDISHNSDWSSVRLLLLPDEHVLWEICPDLDRNENFNIGKFWEWEGVGAIKDAPTTIAVLLKIGHFPLLMSSSIFSDIVVLDDRPTTGGGLPDFSYAAIARLIASLEINANIAYAYVLGNVEHGVKTCASLQSIADWGSTAEKMASKTMMSSQSIRDASDRLRDGVVFCSTEDELVTDFASKLQLRRKLTNTSKTGNFNPPPFLQRELRMTEFALTRIDGCRVKTAAEAYPTVLEIARLSDDSPLITDQAGQQLRELDDFKVHLDTPSQDCIPMFYLDDKEEFDQYFDHAFLNPDGLFAKPLNENNQMDSVLNHIAKIMSLPSDKRYASRRAILVIPHNVVDGHVSPLGLVSIRILPRFINEYVELHYSFTWRTVEALVGFPYSLFGSIRFGEHLTELIKGKVNLSNKPSVRMGALSYVAHSLHMFVDAYGHNIARRIVNDASK